MKRRDFIKGSVSAVPATMALQMLGTRFAFAQSADFANDVEVLNYALTLEYLEAEFYRQGNAASLLSGKEATYLARIGADEDAHVSAITQTIQKLSGTPVAAPAVDFGTSFSSRDAFLKTSHTFENLGVQAYWAPPDSSRTSRSCRRRPASSGSRPGTRPSSATC